MDTFSRNRPLRRAGAALLGSALLATGPAISTSATAAQQDAPRLPYQNEVAQIVADAAGGVRATPSGTGLRGPDLSVEGDGRACNGEVVVARGETGRTAVYRPGPEAATPPVRPTVQERTFGSPADARAALAQLRRAVRECRGGSYPTRSETYTWYQRSTPTFGQDRLGWSLTTTPAGGSRRSYDLHYLALRDDTLVHTVLTQQGALPDTRRAQRLMRLALRTL